MNEYIYVIYAEDYDYHETRTVTTDINKAAEAVYTNNWYGYQEEVYIEIWKDGKGVVEYHYGEILKVEEFSLDQIKEDILLLQRGGSISISPVHEMKTVEFGSGTIEVPELTGEKQVIRKESK